MIFNGYAYLVMMYIVAITRAAISVGWWLFSFTDVKPLTDATSATIGATATQLVGWLLPSALAFGAVAAYTQRRATGSALGQMVWVIVAGVLSISFALAPATWLRGVDGARQLGAGAVMTASSDAMGPTMQTPIAWPEPGFTGTAKDTLLRKSADASWRGFAVTPWCIAEFGSLAACDRYGKGMLDVGGNPEDRTEYINKVILPAEGGEDSPTAKWVKGDNPFGRTAVVMLAAIAATLFGFLNIGLAFTALMAFVGALLLLVVGVFFACLWIIPGRPRQWGMNWFEALVGLVLQSFLAMLVFGTALTLLTAVFSLTGALGWLPVSGLAIAVLIVAFRLRRLLDSLTTMMRPGSGSIMLGGMARRGSYECHAPDDGRDRQPGRCPRTDGASKGSQSRRRDGFAAGLLCARLQTSSGRWIGWAGCFRRLAVRTHHRYRASWGNCRIWRWGRSAGERNQVRSQRGPKHGHISAEPFACSCAGQQRQSPDDHSFCRRSSGDRCAVIGRRLADIRVEGSALAASRVRAGKREQVRATHSHKLSESPRRTSEGTAVDVRRRRRRRGVPGVLRCHQGRRNRARPNAQVMLDGSKVTITAGPSRRRGARAPQCGDSFPAGG